MLLFEKIKNKFFSKPKPTCIEIANRFIMLSDSSTTTCCLDSHGKNSYGNLQKMSIENCVNSKKFKKLTNNLYSSKLCRNCKYLNSNPTSKEIQEYKDNLNKGFKGAQIEIAAKCNYACLDCASNYLHKRREPMPDLDKVFENIKAILPNLEYINCYNYGEPFINPKFINFIEKCRSVNSKLIIGISTNGMLLTREKAQSLVDNQVDWVLFSLHGGPGTENMLKYAQRGADYEKVLENIKQLKEIRDARNSSVPKISIRAILFNWNDTDELMEQFRNDVKKIGITNVNNGVSNEDNYHWILDGASPSERSSQRFICGNKEYHWLKDRKELG